MPVVKLGSIKNAPIEHHFFAIPVYWSDSINKARINVPYDFKKNRTYIALVRGEKGTVQIEGSPVLIESSNVLTNFVSNNDLSTLSGGNVFDASASVSFSFGISFPVEIEHEYGIYVRKTRDGSVASIFSVVIYEL